MIILEYLNAQIQVGNTSYAIISTRPRNNNPMVNVSLVNGNYVWTFTGLQAGIREPVVGDPRQNHFDFYIGLDDLVANRALFPSTRARSLGLAVGGLRNPVGKVRPGGKSIAWSGPLARVTFQEIKISMPPFKITVDRNADRIMNIDREFSKYPINNGNGRTTRELHFGFQNPFIVRPNKSLKVPRITVNMNPNEYATALEAIDVAIAFHSRI
jgi:hypothetical protein